MLSLMDCTRHFTQTTHALSCLSVSYGDANQAWTARSGLMREEIATVPGSKNLPVRTDTLYDLASLTKLFTAIAVLLLRDEGKIDLDAPVAGYEPRFISLGDLKVGEALSFQKLIRTPRRIDECLCREEGLDALFHSVALPLQGARVYSDMPAMTLKYVVEAASGLAFSEFLRKRVFFPLGMTDTFSAVPEAQRARAASYDLEHRFENGRLLVRRGVVPGTPHDPKARLLSHDGRDLCGHAGLFSTEGDLIRFAQALLSGALLRRQTLEEMSQNRTGCLLEGGEHRQYLGYQCFVRHPNQRESEIPVYMGKAALGIGGFTGNHLSVDPARNLFALFLGNRCLNRLTVLRYEPGKTYADYGLNPDGSGVFQTTDGPVYSSVDYVHQKDGRLHEPIRQALRERGII